MTARINSPSLGGSAYQEGGTWSLGIAHRWQYSDKHFVDDQQQHYREQEGSQVINDIHIIDLGASYQITKRIGVTLSVPYSKATRSQALRDPRRARDPVTGAVIRYQDDSGRLRDLPANPSGFPSPEGVINGRVVQRYQTAANGLGDIKLLATTWILDPEKFEKGNVSAGLGVLFPTGESDVKDVFKTITRSADDKTYTIGESIENVDNSIQPGAGAWGIIFDIYSFYQMKENITLFAAGTYIATPEADAGVIAGNPLTSTTVWSVGDSYLARVGGGWTFLPEYGLTFTLAARAEGSPSVDLIGDSTGRRRPGYAISVEPGLVWAKNGWVVAFSTPVAIYRNRTTSFGGSNPGDAAFADFFTLLSVNKRF